MGGTALGEHPYWFAMRIGLLCMVSALLRNRPTYNLETHEDTSVLNYAIVIVFVTSKKKLRWVDK